MRIPSKPYDIEVHSYHANLSRRDFFIKNVIVARMIRDQPQNAPVSIIFYILVFNLRVFYYYFLFTMVNAYVTNKCTWSNDPPPLKCTFGNNNLFTNHLCCLKAHLTVIDLSSAHLAVIDLSSAHLM